MNDFQEKRARRIASYENQAVKNHAVSDEKYQYVRTHLDIANGQPILVGHHSEKKHRSHLKRMDNAMRSSIEAEKKAEYYEHRAEAAANNRAIFSDDPEAIEKLKEQIDILVRRQDFMKEANKLLKADRIQELEVLAGPSGAADLQKPNFCGRTGFPRWQLSNNNANIRRLRERLKVLEQKKDLVTQEKQVGDVRVVQNVEANRVQLFFDGKPEADVRAVCKSRGFRWSPRAGAWQRHLNANGMYAMKKAVEEIEALKGS